MPPFHDAFLTAWTVAWIPDILVVAASVGFAGLVRRRRHGTRQIVSWCCAMATLLLCFNSSIGIYSDTLFSVHMVQHLLLIMVVPPLVVWAEPFSLVPVRGTGPGDAPRTVADVMDASRLWRAVTGPLVAVSLYTATVVLTHLTSFQQAAVGNVPLRIVENVLYLLVGYLLFARLVDLTEAPHRLPDLVRFVVLAVSMGADTLTGVSLMMTAQPLAPAYAASRPGWGPDVSTGQAEAGALMWVVGDGIMMVLMTVVGILWGMRHADSGLGDWLEDIRRRQVVGDGGAAAGADAGPRNIDVDQAALDAYNAYLADLHRHPR